MCVFAIVYHMPSILILYDRTMSRAALALPQCVPGDT